jgi:hyperosmotically inducible protein
MWTTHFAFQLGIWSLTGWLLTTGSLATATEPAPEGKFESSPIQRPKDPDVKAKESDTKLKESEAKPADQKPKEADLKPRESDAKPKDGESKVKEPEVKPKDPEAKTKEPTTKPKESEHKAKEAEKIKEAEQKPKDPDTKPKESDAPPDSPCPAAVHPGDPKTPTDTPSSGPETPSGERPKVETEGKKQPIKSSMVTAKLALMADPRLFPYEIEVDTKDKDLVLLGKVSHESDKKAATEIVRCLEGVHAVENRLKVEPDATHSLVSERDKILTQLVKERFEKSKTLQSVKFDVKTEDAVVTLSGSTRFQIIILEAAQAARQIPGVRAVNTDAVRLIAGE